MKHADTTTLPRTSTALRHWQKIARFAVLPACLAVASNVIAEPATFKVDPEHFSMTFEIMHVGYAPVMGMFREIEGEFVYDEQTQELASGKLVFKSDSVFTNHKKRDQHVTDKDFLNSSKHPDMTFTVTDFNATDDNSGELTGELTGDLAMLGQTHPVTLDITLNKAAGYPFGHEKYTLGISAETRLKRSDWGMTYALENNMVGDEVTLRFGFEAIQE